VLALVLGLLVSAGLYFAYLWPQVEPEEPPPDDQPVAKPAEQAPDAPAEESPPA